MFEALALGGGFDSFGLHRAQFFAPDHKDRPLIELAVRYGAAMQDSANSAQVSLFGGDDGAMDIPEPPIPECETWASMDLLNKERDIVGVYISGHPLDRFRLEMGHLCAKGGLSRFGQLGAGERQEPDVWRPHFHVRAPHQQVGQALGLLCD